MGGILASSESKIEDGEDLPSSGPKIDDRGRGQKKFKGIGL